MPEDTQQLAMLLEPYLIKPPWKSELIEKFPSNVQDEARANDQPIGLGQHPKYGWFALGTGQGPFVIWIECDPNAPKPDPIPPPPPEPYESAYGYANFCPCCGSKLKIVPPRGEGLLRSRIEEYLCTGEDCFYKDAPLTLHHPVYGHQHAAGDSWSLGYVK